MCSNDTARYYKWYYNGNPVQNKYTYVYIADQNLGEYQVAISNDDTCYVTSDKVVIPFSATSSRQPTGENEFYVYPNPTKGKISVFFTGPYLGQILIKIISVNSSVLREYKLKKDHIDFVGEIDMVGIAEGMYIVELVTDIHSAICRFVLMR